MNAAERVWEAVPGDAEPPHEEGAPEGRAWLRESAPDELDEHTFSTRTVDGPKKFLGATPWQVGRKNPWPQEKFEFPWV
jgi:hypothetical protein